MVKNKNKQKILWAALVAALSILIYLATAWYWQFFPFNRRQPITEQTTSQVKPQEKTDDTAQEPLVKPDAEVTKEPEKNLPTQYEGSNPNSEEHLTGAITYKAVSDGQLILRTSIDQTLNSGTCSLSLVNQQKTVNKTATIIPNPASSTCEGFNIPISTSNR